MIQYLLFVKGKKQYLLITDYEFKSVYKGFLLKKGSRFINKD